VTYQDLPKIGRDVGRGGDVVGCHDFLDNPKKGEILRGCRELPLATK
jgi:hypothetical protein